MSMKIDSTQPVSPVPDAVPSDGSDKSAFDKELNKVVGNILNGGQDMLREAMQKFFEDDEEPDEDDPDAEPL